MSQDKQTSPYLIALFTAILSIVGASITSFQVASFQANQSIAERNATCRKEAYMNFLSRIDRKSDRAISELLNVGTLVDKVATDSEIQALEDHFAEILQRINLQTVYLSLNSDLNLLRLCGSKEVNRRAEDLLNVLIGDFSAVDIGRYSASFRQYYENWTDLQQGQPPAYGLEARISSESRASLILVNAMLNQLLAAMNSELEVRIR